MRKHGERGEGRVGALIALAVVGIAIFLLLFLITLFILGLWYD